MTKIDLLKRQGTKKMTLEEFKSWLNQLIVDKKGVLPDLNDWKLIKKNLDSVRQHPTDTTATIWAHEDLSCWLDMTYNHYKINTLGINKYDYSNIETEKTKTTNSGDVHS